MPSDPPATMEESQRQMRIYSARVAEIVAIEGRAAYQRADAWARNTTGAPYGEAAQS